MTRIGLDRISVYPGSLSLSMPELCAARGHDPANIRDVMMVDERSVNTIWEDPVTMAVNAAAPLFDEEDPARIGLLIVSSESGVDQEKPMSTWVHRYLGLPRACRNFELKHACYGGTAALRMALGWIASGEADGRKALVISTDQSRPHFGKPWEFVMGAGAAALLVSDRPRLLEVEEKASGVYTNEVSDLTRPTSQVETGNSETSLLSYLEALEGAFDDYLLKRPDAQAYDTYFQRNIYHVPFGGMGFRAHKTLLRRIGISAKREAWSHFERSTLPSLRYVRRMGATYGSSTFIALLALLQTGDLSAGDRVGMFSYGSGCCAEFWSGLVGPHSRQTALRADLGALLDRRRRLSVPEYEAIETERIATVDSGDFEPALDGLGGWYERYYAGRRLLVFRGMKDYYRRYEWS
jgi:3-hydroxy-3-methylglutaryl CoA synthase